MSYDWEPTFAKWGMPPGDTEKAKCENAERVIKKAINASEKLRSKPIKIFPQGSYANRTNVRQDSDVDICVLYTDAFFSDYSFSQGLDAGILGYIDGTYPYSDFKNDVESALIDQFGAKAVKRGNKAFDVHANTYRVDADVVPCFEHRRFMGTLQNNHYLLGTELRPDDGSRIINWPQQNYDNGVAKNDATNRRFKAVTRIMKRLRNEMTEKGYTSAEPISSFLIECLVWNVPDEDLKQYTYTSSVRHSIAYLWNETRTDESCREWGEVNELKYIFYDGQPLRRAQVNAFLQAVWDYIGFK